MVRTLRYSALVALLAGLLTVGALAGSSVAAHAASWSSGLEDLHGQITGKGAVASWGPGRLDVFVPGTDGQVWHKWYDGQWHGFEPLGGRAVSGVAVTTWGPGRLDVFAQDIDNSFPTPGRLKHRWYVNGQWSTGWEDLGGCVSTPGAASWGPNRIDVLVQGSDHKLYFKWYDGHWNKFVKLGDLTFSSPPSVVAWGKRRLDVFVRGDGPSGNLLHKWYDGTWSRGFENLGGRLIGGPGASSWGAGRLDVFVKGVDGKLYHRWYAEGAWYGFESLGAGFGDPMSASWAPLRVDVFGKGPGSSLVHKWYG